MQKISVIIPAYNAENFIRKAVESALVFDEVEEVILIEDGSSDKTLKVCNQLSEGHHKVKLYTHPDNKNLGAGASRTLGVQKAKCEYIAFIDADDYFLPNRFDAEKKVLFNNPEVDGIYGAIKTEYSSSGAEKLFKEKGQPELLTVNKILSPGELKYALLGMNRNYTGSAFFSLDALTVKKKLIEKAGYFNEKLRLHQDTDLIIKLAFLGNLIPGIINEPVGVRTIHGSNRITSTDYGIDSRSLQFDELLKWLNNNIENEGKAKGFVKKETIILQAMKLKGNKKTKFKSLIRLFKDEPYLLFLEREFERLIKEKFGDNLLVKLVNKLKIIIFRIIYYKRINFWYQTYYH